MIGLLCRITPNASPPHRVSTQAPLYWSVVRRWIEKPGFERTNNNNSVLGAAGRGRAKKVTTPATLRAGASKKHTRPS